VEEQALQAKKAVEVMEVLRILRVVLERPTRAAAVVVVVEYLLGQLLAVQAVPVS
jgi:hypothetical protein